MEGFIFSYDNTSLVVACEQYCSAEEDNRVKSPFEDRDIIGCDLSVGTVGFDHDNMFEAYEL